MSEEKEDIVETARALYKRDVSAWSEIYEKAREDLEFLSDTPGAQWDSKGFQARRESGRPALTIDQLNQFVHQVANDSRKNTPSINVIPAEDSDEEFSKIVKEWIRGIEYKSNADDVYDTAALNAIKSSIGFIRIDHDYCNSAGFDQELIIKRVVNPLAIIIDSDSIDCDGRDAKHGFVSDSMTKKEFEKKYPGKSPVPFDAPQNNKPIKDGDVMVVEFFRIEEEERVITEGKKTRTVVDKKVGRYKMSGADILEQTVFPGDYIPLIPVYGEECWINGVRHLRSLIRPAKDGQMMFNLWKSLEAEMLMKQPQAPWVVAEGQITGYEEGYLNPNKSMVLTYRQRDVDGVQAPSPRREAMPPIPTGIVNAARESVDDIKATMGLYNASIGQRSNETSGVAIQRRQAEGDNAVYHFQDNLTRSITQVGRVLESCRAMIYDGERVISGVDSEDKVRKIGINGAMAADQEHSYDFTRGKHDIRVIAGQNFSTRREEASALLGEIIKNNPAMMQTIGDLWAKNLDVAGSEALYERLHKIVPPQLLAGEDGAEAVDPEKEQLKAALAEMQQQLAQAAQMVESKQGDAQLKAMEVQTKAEIEGAKLQLQKHESDQDAQLRVAELQLKERELAFKEADAERKATLEAENLRLQAAQMQMDAQPMLQDNAAIKQTLDQLTASIAQPKTVVYDENGRIVGLQ